MTRNKEIEPWTLRKLARHLREEFPAPEWTATGDPAEVRIRRLPMPRRPGAEPVFAKTKWTGRRFVIYLGSALRGSIAKDTLLHEWAHVLTWDEKKAHGPRWAAANARLHRWFYAEDEFAQPG